MADVILMPTDGNPIATYLNSLRSKASRDTMSICARNIQAAYPKSIREWGFEDAVNAYRALNARYSNPYTVNKHLACLRGIIRAHADLGLIKEDMLRGLLKPLKDVRGKRVPAGRMLKPTEIAAMFTVCNRQTPIGARDAAMLVCLRCGLRRDEVCGLSIDDYQPPVLRVLGKGDKERNVPLPEGGEEIINRWLLFRGHAPGALLTRTNPKWPSDGESPVFTNYPHLTGQGILERIAVLAEAADVRNVTAHDFRRTLASELLSEVDEKTVQDLLGHENVQTTLRYDRRGDERMRAAMKLVSLTPTKQKEK